MSGGQAGFTLLELMVVCVIIGIMTAMILPEMRGTYEEAILRSSGRELINVFQLARSRAIVTRQPHRVRFDRKVQRCRLERAAQPGEVGSGYVPAEAELRGAGALDRRISIEIRRSKAMDVTGEADGLAPNAAGDGSWNAAPPDAIGFYPDGTADAGDIVLRDRLGSRLVLRINAVTARVQVIDGGRE
jgi:type II secretion system protein H